MLGKVMENSKYGIEIEFNFPNSEDTSAPNFEMNNKMKKMW
jgi:hypothetical protein